MAKTKYILRTVPAGAASSGTTVTVKDVAAATQATPTTDANGIATYEVDGSVGPLIASATVGSRTVYRDGRSLDQMGTWFPQDIPRALRVLGNGVIPGYTGPGIEAEDMQVTPGTGLQVLVGEGVILLDGHLYGCTASTALTIGANASGSTRYDRVVARFTREGQTTEGKFVLAILAGTPGAGDGAALTKSDVTYEFSLARITVINGAASFVSGDITDERYSTSLNQAYVFTNPNAFDAATTGYRAGDILYVSNAGKLTRLAKGTDDQVLKLASGLPAWTSQTIAVANISDLTASAAELNIMDGATLTVTELNYVDGVTSAIQTQIDGKAATSHTHTLSAISDITATATEVNYTDGVTSAIQTQFTGKSATTHTHTQVATLSGKATNAYTNVVSIDSTDTDDVCNFNLGPLVSGVTYDVHAKGGGQANAPSGQYITAYIRIESGGSVTAGYGTGTVGGERQIEAFDSKSVVGAGATINISFRAATSSGTGSVNGALVYAWAIPRDVPAS